MCVTDHGLAHAAVVPFVLFCFLLRKQQNYHQFMETSKENLNNIMAKNISFGKETIPSNFETASILGSQQYFVLMENVAKWKSLQFLFSRADTFARLLGKLCS